MNAIMAKKRSKRRPRRKARTPRLRRSRAETIRIFAKAVLAEEMAKRVTAAAPRVGFDRPVTPQGQTEHFKVYYQTGFANGPLIAGAVLATNEKDFQTLEGFFGGLVLPNLPMNIIVAPGIGGAYHYRCDAVDLYCDGDPSPNPDADHTRMLVVAEEVEVFEGVQGKGWDCSASNGEGLSRVLAAALYPAALDGFATAAAWLDSPSRPDWVSRTKPTDQDEVSNGCAVLFLNYLSSQLNFSWGQIVQAAGSTFEQTYKTLTGKAGGFAPFKALLDSHFPPGQPSGLTTDNPFPLD